MSILVQLHEPCAFIIIFQQHISQVSTIRPLPFIQQVYSITLQTYNFNMKWPCAIKIYPYFKKKIIRLLSLHFLLFDKKNVCMFKKEMSKMFFNKTCIVSCMLTIRCFNKGFLEQSRSPECFIYVFGKGECTECTGILYQKICLHALVLYLKLPLSWPI